MYAALTDGFSLSKYKIIRTDIMLDFLVLAYDAKAEALISNKNRYYG